MLILHSQKGTSITTPTCNGFLVIWSAQQAQGGTNKVIDAIVELGIQVPSQKVRLEPPGTYITVSPNTVPEKVRLDP